MGNLNRFLFTHKSYRPYFAFWKTKFASLKKGFEFHQKNRPSGNKSMMNKAYEIYHGQGTPLFGIVGNNDAGIFVALISAFALTFKKYLGREFPVLIDTPLNDQNVKIKEIHSETVTAPLEPIYGTAFRDYLNSNRELLKECYQYQNFPLQLIDPAIEKKQSFSNVLISYNGIHRPMTSLTRYDLIIDMDKRDDNIVIDIAYNNKAFEEFVIDNLVVHVSRILKQLDRLDTMVEDLDILGDDHLQNAQNIVNSGSFPVEDDRNLVRLFERQAVKTPDSIAVVDGDIILTYGEVKRLSDLAAKALRANYYVKSGDLVGLITDRSAPGIISILGTLKTGAAYLPIDSGYPLQRVDFMLKNAAVNTIIKTVNYPLENDNAFKIIAYDRLIELGEESPPFSLRSKIDSSALAYVIYTSGSTGRPKGVKISHQSVWNIVKGLEIGLQLSDRDKFILTSSLSFDASVKQIFIPLSLGAELHVAGDINDVGRLISYVKANEINVMHGVPTLWSEIMQLDKKHLRGLSSLRCISSGGDLLPMDLANEMALNFPDCRVYNMYGPTETCINASYFAITEPLTIDPPVGKALPGYEIFVLDENLENKPIGFPGEIFIGGKGLALGYINSPDVQSDNFIDNPFKEGEILYRTGDFGRWNNDGDLLFIGRKDDQVKVRGHRVELGEIEHVLRQCDERIVQAAILQDDGKNSDDLIAYIQAGEQPDVRALREELLRRLPSYMIPNRFIALKKMPLTNVGKVDKKRLHECQGLSLRSAVMYKPPTSKTEKIMSRLWRSLLHHEEIGIAENFFELGGNSLVAYKLMTRIYKEFNVDIDLKKIFEYPTIESLAAFISKEKKSPYANIKKLAEREFYATSYGQKRQWVVDHQESEQAIYNMAGAYLLEGPLHLQAFKSALEIIVQRHESLRTTFHLIDGEILQKVHSLEKSGFKVEVIDYSEKEAPFALVKEGIENKDEAVMDLSSGPLTKFKLYKIEKEKFILFISIDHIVADGFSMEILIREFSTLYNRLKEGETSAMVPLGVQYKEFADWQNKLLDDAAYLKKHKTYWKNVFTSPPPLLDLPLDHDRPVKKTLKGGKVEFEIDAALSDKFKAFCRTYGVTHFMLFLTFVKTFLYRLSNQKDIIIGTGVAGRHHGEFENQIGLYANILPLRSEISGRMSFMEFVNAIKEDTLEAFRHQDYPFLKIIEDLDIKWKPSRNPLFDVMLIVQPDYLQDLDIQDIKVSEIPIQSTESIFDLFFNVKETQSIFKVDLTYRADIFDKETINRFTTAFKALVENALYNTETSLDMLELSVCRSDDARKRLFYIMDANRNQLPDGFLGEICVSYEALHDVGYASQGNVVWRGIRTLKTNDKGRRIRRGALDQLSAKPEGFLINGQYYRREELEAKICKYVNSAECILSNYRDESGGNFIVAHVKDVVDLPHVLMEERSNNSLPDDMLQRLTFNPVNNMPVNQQGEIDIEELNASVLLTSGQIQKIEDQISSITGLKRAVLTTVPKNAPRLQLHLSDFIDTNTLQSRVKIHRQKNLKENNKATKPRKVQRLAYLKGKELKINREDPHTLTEALISARRCNPENGIIIRRSDGDDEVITYKNLYDRASETLSGLHAHGLKQGEIVIFQIDALPEFFPLFWACVLGGVIPVIVAVPPIYGKDNAVVEKLLNAWNLFRKPTIIASDKLLAQISLLKQDAGLNDMNVISYNSLVDFKPAYKFYESKPEDTLYIQLSSGSSNLSKGILMAHKGVVNHIRGVRQFNNLSDKEVSFNWMPLDHVGALCMWHLRDVYVGAVQIHVSTIDILQKPLLWLAYMEKYKVTNSWSPNFGYKLLTEEIEKTTDLSFNLSSLKRLLNGGEQVTLDVFRRFINETSKFGVKPSILQPAYGMAEMCSAITLNNSFSFDDSIIYAEVHPESGDVLEIDNQNPTTALICVGKAINGVELRIADENDNIIEEGKIGRIQAKSESRTPGYFDNEQADKSCLLKDRWYNTGDLGFIKDSSLYITGREKEMIIIRGVHYYYYNLEDYTGQLEGVDPTCIGACSVTNISGTEELAIFFAPLSNNSEVQFRTVESIKKSIAKKFGITPYYVIPVEKSLFPKTTSGKVQRAALKKWFIEGKFSGIIKKIEIVLKNEQNTVPDYFFEKAWVRKSAPSLKRKDSRQVALLFRPEDESFTFPDDKFSTVINVRRGRKFQQAGNHDFIINPIDKGHYEALLRKLSVYRFTHVVHAWSYEYIEAWDRKEGIQKAQELGLFSLLYFVQALKVDKMDLQKLCVISSASQRVGDEDLMGYGKTTLQGFVKTLTLERPDLRCVHIDLYDSRELNEDSMLRELYSENSDTEIAYRQGVRYVAQLRKAHLTDAGRSAINIHHGGIYLIAGGLGAVGFEIAKYLIKTYQIKLAIIGRTNLKSVEPNKARSEKADRLERLLRLSPEIIYESTDICDTSKLKEIISRAEDRWDSRLKGVIHLAGTVVSEEEYLNQLEAGRIQEVGIERFHEHFHAKIYGSHALGEALRDYHDVQYIAFSSALSQFGGYASAPYTAANSFLDGYMQSISLRISGQAQCINWSLWNNIGVNKESQFKRFNIDRGFMPISTVQGVNSFEIALQSGLCQIFIGLDPSNDYIRRNMMFEKKDKEACLFLECAPDAAEINEANAILNKYLKTENYRIRRVEKLPLDHTGKVDKSAFLSRRNNDKEEKRTLAIEPRTETERTLIEIWKEILKESDISVADNFFEIGGHSVKAVRIISRIHKTMGVKVELKELFINSTIEKLARLIQEAKISQYESINSVKEQTHYEVSHSQKRLWLLHQYESQLTAYNYTTAFSLTGMIKIEALAYAIERLVERHESLRTTFIEVKGTPRQKIRSVDDCGVKLNFIDFSSMSGSSRRLKEKIKAETQTVFDLEKGPLLRFTLIKIKEDKHVFVICMHHIITDAWSMELMLDEIIKFYDEASNNIPAGLQPLKIQYKDFVAWQNKQLQNVKTNNHRQFWLEQFSDEIPALNLPTDKPRGSEKTFSGSRRHFQIDKNVSDSLTKFSQRKGVSLFMTLLASVKVLLYKYSGQCDLIIGSPVAGRSHIDLEGQIGFYVNTLAIRTKFEDNESFEKLLDRVRISTLDAYDHQIYPFDRLVDDLALERDMSRSPLFDVMAAMQNTDLKGRRAATMPNVAIEELPIQPGVSKFDLTFNFHENETGIDVTVEFNDRLYSSSRIERMAAHYIVLLSSILKQTRSPVYKLEYLTAQEKRLLFKRFIDTKKVYPDDLTIHQLFERQVSETPDAVSLIHNRKSITYAELNRKANKLAHHLRASYGSRRDTVIGIMAERSENTIVAMLGALKSGAAYLPLDPENPVERTAYILDKASSIQVICDKSFKKNFEEFEGYELICLDDDWPIIEKCSPYNPSNINAPRDLAYVIFTSGSTGAPKGVMIEHGGNVNMSLDQIAKFGITSSDNVLQFASFSFDASVSEIFMAFYAGATLTLIDKDIINDTTNFEAFLKDNNISVVTLPPAYLNILSSDLFQGIKTLITAGEAPNVERAVQCSAYCNYFNAYGPTECAVCVSIHRVSPHRKYESRISIGKPIANMQAFILDKRLQPVAIGMEGELCVAGVGLARGYINEPELTKENFVGHPFEKGKKLYKTGDIARWKEDGSIDFIGRKDSQIKIRGHRVEMAEIEKTFLKLKQIKDCRVVVRSAKGEKRLAAYIIKNPSSANISLDEIKRKIGQYLPFYMIPSHIKEVDHFPLTSNGKLDIGKLPEPNNAGDKPTFIQPSDRAEEILLKVLKKTLDLKEIDADANFFEIGGDSIKAIQIASGVQKYGYKLTVKDIFKNQRIGGLGKILRKLEAESDQNPVIGVGQLSPIQLEFLSWRFKNPNFFNQSLMLTTKEKLDPELLNEIFMKIVEHHDILRASFDLKSDIPECYYGESPGVAIPVETFDFKDQNNFEELIEKYADRVQSSLSASKGPLIKLALFKIKDGSLLLIVVHHLIIDMVSWRILLEDFSNLYRLKQSGEALQLPLKTEPYKKWVEDLREYAGSENFEDEKTFWNAYLAEPSEALPTDFTKGSNAYKDSGSISFSLNKSKTSAILKKANRAFNTDTTDILLCALGRAFGKVFNKDYFLVDLEGHGRDALGDRIDISRTVGWFTRLFPFKLRLGKDKNIADQLQEIKESRRQIPSNGCGYGIYKHLCQDEWQKQDQISDQSHISFNYLGQFDEDVSEGLFDIASDTPGRQVDGNEKRKYYFEISGYVREQKLHIYLNYSKNLYKAGTAELLAETFCQEIDDLVSFCMERDHVALTPSDVSCSRITKAQLSALSQKYQIEDIYELTPMQEGLYFHALADRNTGTYFEQFVYHIEGELNIDLVKKSLDILFEHFEALRAGFVHESLDQVLQIIVQNRKAEFHFEDLRRIAPKQEREELAARLKAEDKTRSFKLDQDSLMRMTILQLEDNVYQVIWSHHHIIMDGWCMTIIMSRFFDVYNAILQGNKPNLKPTPPFRDYVNWIKMQDKEQALKYWTDYLKGYEHLASIPSSNKIQDEPKTYEKAEIILELSRQKTQALKALAAEQRTTLNSLIQTLWGILLAKYNNVRDVVYGAVVSGRPTEIEDIDQMVGLFINTVPARVQYAKNESFAECLQRVHRDAINRDRYHFVQLAEIQAKTVLQQNLLDHILVFINYPIDEQISGDAKKVKGIMLSGVEVFEQTSFNLNLRFIPGDKLTLNANYNAAEYSDISLKRLWGHFELLVNQTIANPDVSISKLSLISAGERRALRKFNNTTTRYPRNKTLSRLFEEQVAKTPEAVAVVYNKKTLSYSELNRKANKLARFLKKQYQLKPNQFCGVMMNRSEKMLIGILAIIKSGAAYVPIDPESPNERKKYILDDCKITVLLVDSDLMFAAAEFFDGNLFALDIQLDDLSESDDNPRPVNEPLDTAYVMYTSGSTGAPKGVMVAHRNIVRLVSASQPFKLKAGEKLLQTGALTFDASTFELWGMALNGGELHMISKEEALNVPSLKSKIRTDQITMTWFTSSWFNQLVDSDVSLFSTLKYLIVGGEQLSPKHIQRVQEACPKLRVINGYGPTEAVTFSTYHLIERVSSPTENIPIGKPLHNTSIHVLDSDHNVMPLGLIGEICIGGDGLAKGYLNNESLTKEKFVTCKIFDDDVLIYKTGDLGAWIEDGVVKFFGRKDNQIKIRGYRIELGEIEDTLAAFEPIEKIHISVSREDGKVKNIIAYYTSKKVLKPDELSAFLKYKLPSYMIPNKWIQMSEFPLTANGKIDRKALPDPDNDQFNATDHGHVEPETELEKLLASIWKDALGKERISVNENFFMAGGDSIKAIQVSSRLQNAGYQLDIKDLFTYPSIEEIGRIIQPATRKIDQGLVSGSVPLTAIQRYFFSQNLKRPDHFNQSVMLQPEKPFSIQALKAAFEVLLRHHDALRMTFDICDNKITQTNTVKEFKILQVYNLKNLANPVAALNEKCNLIQSSLELKSGPLIKATLFQLKEKDLLLIAIHHLAVDGVSWRIILEDLETLIDQYTKKTPLNLPSKTDSYKIWAEKILEYANSSGLLSEKPYWKALESTDCLKISKKNNTANYTVESRQVASFSLSTKQSKQLLYKINQAFNTEINDILLIALGMTVKEAFDAENIPVALESHGREQLFDDVDITRTVGWFTNIYPVIINIPETDEMGNIIKNVKEDLRKIPNNGIGYGILKYITADKNKKDINFNLHPEICFNYLGQFDSDLANKSFLIADEPMGAMINRDENLFYELDVSGMIVDSKLQISIAYSSLSIDKNKILRFKETFHNSLIKIIRFCVSRTNTEMTASDFTYDHLSQEELQSIAGQFE